ncbi:transposase [Hymenobacter siberiensis]|uniref:transposase n=1 Tax=Hymenobacter siberiensis TaxID=2848396 RepID=UPI001C1E5F1D|nr:transposase [Hymenobacter siberiensis]
MTPKRTRRRYTAEFKAEVALAALTERQPLAELAAHSQLATAQITRWKLQLREQATQVFTEAPAAGTPLPDVEPLLRGHRSVANGKRAAKKNATPMSSAQQRVLVQASDPAGSSVAARCQALGLARSSFYYQPCGESAYNLELMRLLNEEFTDHNFNGVLGLRDHLRLAGHAVNAKRVRRLVRLMGHEPIYPKPRLSIPGQGVTP